MSRPDYKEVVDIVPQTVMVLAKEGCVFIKQDCETIIISSRDAERLSESIMKAGAASIRARKARPE